MTQCFPVPAVTGRFVVRCCFDSAVDFSIHIVSPDASQSRAVASTSLYALWALVIHRLTCVLLLRAIDIGCWLLYVGLHRY